MAALVLIGHPVDRARWRIRRQGYIVWVEPVEVIALAIARVANACGEVETRGEMPHSVGKTGCTARGDAVVQDVQILTGETGGVVVDSAEIVVGMVIESADGPVEEIIQGSPIQA